MLCLHLPACHYWFSGEFKTILNCVYQTNEIFLPMLKNQPEFNDRSSHIASLTVQTHEVNEFFFLVNFLNFPF